MQGQTSSTAFPSLPQELVNAKHPLPVHTSRAGTLTVECEIEVGQGDTQATGTASSDVELEG